VIIPKENNKTKKNQLRNQPKKNKLNILITMLLGPRRNKTTHQSIIKNPEMKH
jgi:hypothetical protein